MMKKLRIKKEVMGGNKDYIEKREALRKWFKRVQVTLYMRKRTIKLMKEWNCKVMRTCFEAIKENSVRDKKFMRKVT